MKSSKRLIFFGTEDFSLPSLLALLWHKWHIIAVVTKPDTKAGRGQKLSVPQVKQIARNHNIEVLQPYKVSEINGRIRALKPTHGVLVAYGKIIPQSTLDLFPGGIINAHPSLLPKYRGPSPIEATILNGDKETGVSLMRLTAQMDAGPVYYQSKFWLSKTANRLTLTGKLSQMAAQTLAAKLSDVLDGSLKPMPQDDSEATYTKLLKKDDGKMDFGQPALALERQVRAYAGWPKSRTKIQRQEVIVTKARVAKDENDGTLVIKCQTGYLEIVALIAPSGRTMSGADFLRGYKK